MKGMYKNKITFFILFAILLCILCGCHKKEAMHYTVDYGNSSVYTKAEMDEAIEVVEDTARHMKCSLLNLRYTSDKCNSRNMLKGLNKGIKGKPYIKRIELIGDLKTSKDVHATLVPNYVYKNWMWVLACKDNSSWEIINYGPSLQ